jgi:uncharacterized phage-associated protein
VFSNLWEVRLMPIPYQPLAAANYFISNFGGGALGIEHMKLQKLVYFSHGWWLTAHPDPFLNERPQIWKHGPVFSSLYHVLKTFGGVPITIVQSASPFTDPPTIDDNSTEVRSLLNWIWQKYGHLSSFALSDMTHREGTAWSRVAAERNFSVPRGLEIPDDYIREEFRSLLVRDFESPEVVSDARNDRRGRTAA